MSTIDLVKISKMGPDDFARIRSGASRHLETLLRRGGNALTRQQFSAEDASVAAADFEALMYEQRPKLGTTGNVRQLVLNYYALVAEACKDINLLTRHWWVDQLLADLEPWQVEAVRNALKEYIP